MFNIFTRSAIAGAGKTWGACDYILERAYRDDARVVMVQPSRELIQQTERDLRAKMAATGEAVTITSIYSSGGGIHTDRSDSVNSRITTFLKEASQQPVGQILLITHAAFLSMPFWLGAETWEVIIDEIPNVAPLHAFYLEADSGKLKQIARVERDDQHTDFYRVLVNDTKAAEDSINLKNDEKNVYRGLSRDFLHPHIEVFCHRSSWDRLSTKGHHYIEFYSIIQPSLVQDFAKVTIMGAHFEDSLLAMTWGNAGVTFITNLDIKLRHTQHDIGQRRLDIWYLSESDWSKSLRQRIGCSETSIEPLIPGLQAVLGSDDFIWCANNDTADRAVRDVWGRQGERISNVCHGINAHQGVHKVLILSALNLTPAHISILEKRFSVDPTELKRSCSHETIYQVALRCSARDPASTAPITVVVPDRAMAEWFATQFKPNGNIRVKRVPTGIAELERQPVAGRPPVLETAMSAKERVKAARERKRQLREEVMALCMGLGGCNETPPIRTFVTPVDGSIPVEVSLIASRQDQPIPFQVSNNEALIAQLRTCWEYSADNKHANILISPAKFAEKAGVDTKRGLENVVSVNGVWLDQDGGTLTPDEMERIFPGTRFVAMNSYSGNIRYFFPTTTPMTLAAYHAIWDAMVGAIEGYGYSRDPRAADFHGLDASKRPGCSMFYVPCQANDKAKSFWREFPGEYLDPVTWIDNYALPEPTEYRPGTPHRNPQSPAMVKLQAAIAASDDRAEEGTWEARRREKTDAAINEWRNASKGDGSRQFFILAQALDRLGHDHGAIRTILEQETIHARSPSERRKEIPGLLKKLGGNHRHWSGHTAEPGTTNPDIASGGFPAASDRLRKVIAIQRGNGRSAILR